MKAKFIALFLALALVSSSFVFAQDASSPEYQAKKESLIGVPYTPDQYVERPPVRQENNMLFLSNCPETDRPTCLKEPFDSATWTLAMARNDDGSSVLINLPFTFTFYGVNYTRLYINNNGNITFSAPLATFTPSAFPSSTFGAIVAPFFADVDTRLPTSGTGASGVVYYKITGNRIAVTWDSVGYYNRKRDKRCTFQAILSDGTDPVVGIGNNVCFSYGTMQWTTGDASQGVGGFGPPSTAATVGLNKGDGISYITLGRFCRPGSYYGGPSIDTNGVSYLDCQNFCFDATGGSNVCPVSSGFPAGNSVNVTAPPYNAVYSMSAPELTQIVTGFTSPLPPGMTVNISNGLTSTFTVSFTPDCPFSTGPDSAEVCFSGVDNHPTAPCTTTVCVKYYWDCTILPVEMSAFNSSVDGRNVILDWTTATELNNAKFEIERRMNNEWTKVGEVSGNGTTTSPRSYSYSDRGLSSGTYNYRLKQVDYNGSFAYHNLSTEVLIGVPNQFELVQNYPNPFNPSTKIDYSIPFDGNVSLTIFDGAGKEVAKLVNNTQPAGFYSVDFNASSFASGIYYYRIDVNGQRNFTATKKMLLVK